MQYTLHLTNECNLKCNYCGQKHSCDHMSTETAYKAVDFALSSNQKSIGIGFYGGEPLLCKSLIYEIVQYTKKKTIKTNTKIYYKLTTNGVFLDDEFIDYAKKEGILISLSLDGNKDAHDMNRIDCAGNGSYEKISKTIPKLLLNNRYTSVMMTVAPNTVRFLYDSICHIYSLGLISIICSLDYSAIWDESSLNELKRQYQKLAAFYYENTKNEKKFFLSMFDSKINSHIHRKEYCADRCRLGYEQILISTNGILFPCVQFVGDIDYQIGHVDNGIDEDKRKSIFKQSCFEHQECQRCSIKGRCNHTCACINKCSTGNLTEPSPVLCFSERSLIPIVDKVASKLYKNRNGMFIQKHYNELYSLVSLVEDNEIYNNMNGAEQNETAICKNL